MLFGAVASPAQTPALTVAQKESYQRLAQQLIAPCCWREPIAMHRSAEALQMQDEVRQWLLQGRTEDEIKATYVSRYGDRILADPPGLTGRWLYVMPVAVFLGLLLLAARRLRVLVRMTPASPPRSSPEFLALVRKETNNEWV